MIDNVNISKLLIQHGAIVSNIKGIKNTPLHNACYNVNYDMIAMLMESNASLDCVDKRGFYPLDLLLISIKVSEIKYYEDVKKCFNLLLKYNASIYFSTIKKVINYGCKEAIKLLLNELDEEFYKYRILNYIFNNINLRYVLENKMTVNLLYDNNLRYNFSNEIINIVYVNKVCSKCNLEKTKFYLNDDLKLECCFDCGL
jgi:ankyrin repeat protein